MRSGFKQFFGVTILLCMQCSKVDVAPELVAAYDQVVAAAKIKDAGALYDLSVPELQDEFVNLLKRMKAIEDAILTVYPASEHHLLRQDLALSFSDGCQDPRCLFVNLVGFSGYSFDTDVEFGFSIVDVEYSQNGAEIRTQGGERFRFRRLDDGTWKTTLVWDAYTAWTDRERWLANLAQAEQNVEQLRRRVDEQRDPRTPEGAINLFRDSFAENNLDVLFTLLDDKTKKTLDDLVLRAHIVDAVRPSTAPWNLAMAAASGRKLFEALWNQKLVGEGLPRPVDKIVRIETDSPSSVLGVLTGEKRVHLVRGKQDIWRITDLNIVLERLFSDAQRLPNP